MATVYTYGAENQHFQKLSSYPALNIATYPLFFGNAAFLFCIHSVVCFFRVAARAPRDIGNVAMPTHHHHRHRHSRPLARCFQLSRR